MTNNINLRDINIIGIDIIINEINILLDKKDFINITLFSNIRELINELQDKKHILSCSLLEFYTWQKIINSEKVSNELFFNLLFSYLEDTQNISKYELDKFKTEYKETTKEEHIKPVKNFFSDLVLSILSNQTKKNIWLENLSRIENKVRNKEQSELILNFLEKNQKYIESTIFLISWVNDINKITKIILNIIDYENILKLTDDSLNYTLNYSLWKNRGLETKNIIDIYFFIDILNKIKYLDRLIRIINNTKINNLIKIINILWPYEFTKLVDNSTDIENIIININKLNHYDINLEWEKNTLINTLNKQSLLNYINKYIKNTKKFIKSILDEEINSNEE